MPDYESFENTEKVLVTGGAALGALAGLFAPAFFSIKGLEFIQNKITDRQNKKKIVEMVMKNPSVAQDFQELVKKYKEGSLTMSQGERQKYLVQLIEKIGIDKLKKVAEEEMKKVPEMIDLPPVKKSEWFYLLKSER
tara:strand:+ start:1290 stop:1700 length:411 start_codon:yes stop_codon:yes gene_type:complete